MKKALGILTAVAVTAAAAADASAQTRLGIRGGLSLSTLSGDELVDVGSRTGVNVGATLLFGLGEGNLGLQLGAGIADKGASVTFGDDEGDADASINLTYIEIPVLLHYAVPTQGSISPHFVAGPALSFEMGCDIDGVAGGVSVSLPCEDAGLPVSSFDIGIMGGAGVDIATSSALTITFDALYNYGLSTVDGSDDPDDVKNRAWSFLAGLAFPL